MTNVDFDPDYIPDPEEYWKSAQRSAIGSVMPSEDGDDPAKAARALDVADVTGLPSTVVHNDLDTYEQQLKSKTSASLIQDNPALMEYINSHPLASKVSANDLGQLDVISEYSKKYGARAVSDEAIKAFKENFDAGTLGEEYAQLSKMMTDSPVFGNIFVRQAALVGALTLAGSTRLVSGLIGGASGAIGELYKQTGLEQALPPEMSTPRLTRDLIAGAQVALVGAGVEGVPKVAPEAVDAIQAKWVMRYIAAGQDVPKGVSPVFDELKAMQAEKDMDALAKLKKEVDKSETKDLAPKIFNQNFLAQHPELDGNIGISSEAVKKLYGEEEPAPGDGKLGDVITPEALRVAALTGGDVQVKLRDFLTHVDADVEKELHENIRPRDGGDTLEEAKTPPPTEAQQGTIEEPGASLDKNGDAVEAVRQAAGLEPLPIVEEPAPTMMAAEGPKAETISGEAPIVRREGPTVKPTQLELPQAGTTRIPERALVDKAALVGFNKASLTKLLQLIQKRNEEDIAWQKGQVEKAERKRQTSEWKENESKLRPEAVDAVNARPAVKLSNILDEEKVKIDPTSLELGQLGVLPSRYFAKGGVDIHDLAYHVGAVDSTQAIFGLKDLLNERGTMKSFTYRRKLIDEELQRRMEEKYGDLDANILEAAKDRALSPTQLDLLHEHYLRIAEKAGQELPLKREDMEAQMKAELEQLKVGDISSNKYLAEAGRARGKVDEAWTSQKWTEALKAQEEQTRAFIMARAAKAYEGERKQFDSLANTYSKRGKPGDLVAGTAQEYTNVIHDILMRTMPEGFVKRSAEDLAEQMDRDGYKSLDDFVGSKFDKSFGMNEVPIADFLLNPKWKKPLDSLTLDEFHQLRDTVKALSKLGKDELKWYREGQAYELEDMLKPMRAELGTFPLVRGTATPTLIQSASRLPKSFLAASTSFETLANRWDRNNPHGPFNRVVYSLFSAANGKDRLVRQFAKVYKDLGEPARNKTLIDSPFIDPRTVTKDNPSGDPFSNFTHGNVQVLIHNAGNEGNFRVLSQGYGVAPEKLLNWLAQNSTLDQWQRAEKMGNTIFKPAFEMSQVAYHRIYGIAPEKIQLKPFEIKLADGSVFKSEGWYHPLIAHPEIEGFWDADGNKISSQSRKQLGGGIYDGPDNFHTRTANGYTKSRTGAVYPLDLNPDMIPIRLTQMLHDISYREAIINAEKIFKNGELRSEITKHYGSEYTAGLFPYLKSLAGEEGIPSRAMAEASRLSEYLRRSTIGHLIGLNPYTVLKHGPTAFGMSIKEVGPINYLRAMKALYTSGEDITEANKKWIDENIEDVGRRKRYWQDTISGQHKNLYGESTLWEKTLEVGAWPVAQSDMFSVRPLALAAFWKELERQEAAGEAPNRGLAMDIASRSVRRAHGSTAAPNQPAIVRGGGPLHSWLTSVYGFFGTVMQRRLEIAHMMADTYRLGKQGEFTQAAANIPELTSRIVAHVILPTIIEEAVTGLTTDDKRGWRSHLFYGALGGLGSSWVYLREVTNAIQHNTEPGFGLTSDPINNFKKVEAQLRKGKKMFSKHEAGRTVGSALAMFGNFSGLPNLVANAARFGIDTAAGVQHPRTIGDYTRGITRGVMKPRIVK